MAPNAYWFRPAWVLAGDAIFSVKVPDAIAAQHKTSLHYTYKVFRAELPASGRFPARVAYFISVLRGPDNTSDYAYLGEVNPDTGEIKRTTKSSYPESAYCFRLVRRLFDRVWDGKIDDVLAAGFAVNHDGRCARCRRLLTVPESVERGLGPECFGLV